MADRDPSSASPVTEFQLETQTIRQRGPRVHIRIRGLLEYLIVFNRPKIYLDPDCAAQTVAVAPFIHLAESKGPGRLWTRLKALWR